MPNLLFSKPYYNLKGFREHKTSKECCFLCRRDSQRGTTIQYYFTAYGICLFRCPRVDFPNICLRVGILTPLANSANSSFKCLKARFFQSSITGCMAQTGQGPHTVWESISSHLFHVPQADSTISVSFPESQLMLCLAVINCLSKSRNSNLGCIMKHRNSSLASSITFIMLHHHSH